MKNQTLIVTSVFFLFFLCWEILANLYDHLLFVLPPPSRIFLALVEAKQSLLFHSSITLKEMLGGFFLALCVAFPLGWMMQRFKTSRAILQPLFIIIQCLPMFTLAPLMILWFGWSYTAILIPTALMIFFPLTLNIYQGLRSTPQDLLDFFYLNQATKWQTFIKLRIPYALPHIFGGFRISAAISGIGAVAGEWAGAQHGLGILILESRRNADLELTFGALFCLTMLTTSLYFSMLFIEKCLIFPQKRWFSLRSFFLSFFTYKKRLASLIFFVSFISFLGVSSCYKEKKPKIRLLLDWIPNPNHIPLYVGIEKGYFAEEGIDLMIQKMQENGGGISYLTSKQADLLIMHMPGALRALSKGAHISWLATLIQQPLRAFIYNADPEIKNIKDLSDKVLGYCIGSPETVFLDFLLQEGDISPKEKKNVSIDLISAMKSKSVDFIYGGFWNIEPAQLKSVGIETHFFKIEELGLPHYNELIIIGNAESKTSSSSFKKKFQRALQKAIIFCQCYPEEAFSFYLQQNPDKRSKTIAWERESWEVTYPLLASNQEVDATMVKTFYHWQLEHGIIKHPLNFESFLN